MLANALTIFTGNPSGAGHDTSPFNRIAVIAARCSICPFGLDADIRRAVLGRPERGTKGEFAAGARMAAWQIAGA